MILRRIKPLLLGVIIATSLFATQQVKAEEMYDLGNSYKGELVIDDPINFDYDKWFLENYEFGTNDEIISIRELSLTNQTPVMIKNLVMVNKPKIPEDKLKVSKNATLDYERYRYLLQNIKTGQKNVAYNGILLDKTNLNTDIIKYYENLNQSVYRWLINEEIEPIYVPTQSLIIADKKTLEELEPVLKEIQEDNPNLEEKNYFYIYNWNMFYKKSNYLDGNIGEYDVIPAENIIQKWPKNFTDIIVSENYHNSEMVENGKFKQLAKFNIQSTVLPLDKNDLEQLGEKDINKRFYKIKNIVCGLHSDTEYEYSATLEYNHPPTYKADSKLKFKETREYGTQNLILPTIANIQVLKELEGYLKDENSQYYNSQYYKEAKEQYEMYKKQAETETKNVEIYLNSKLWSTKPLTMYIGNVESKEEKLTFKTITEEDPTLPFGETKVKIQGKNGVMTTRIEYEVDEKTGELKNPKPEVLKTEPIDEVILIGTKVVNPEKTKVVNENHLTLEEKDLVKEAVKKANPQVENILVKDNGDVEIKSKEGNKKEFKQNETVYEEKTPTIPSIPSTSSSNFVSGTITIKETNTKVDEKLNTEEHYAYIVGYPDRTFRPNKNITRAEVSAIFSRLSRTQKMSSENTFKDINSKDWYYKSVMISLEEELIKGYEDGTFKPNQPMTREEFASTISTFANKTTKDNHFTDVKGWSKEAINTAYVNEWMQGYKNGKFKPNENITRAEVVTTINKMLNRNPDKDFIDKAQLRSDNYVKPYIDVNSKDWFFYDVYAASWGHDYKTENGQEQWLGLNGKIFTIK